MSALPLAWNSLFSAVRKIRQSIGSEESKTPEKETGDEKEKDGSPTDCLSASPKFWADTASSADKSHDNWNSRLEALLTYRQFSEAWNLLEEMKMDGAEVDSLLLVSLIKQCEGQRLPFTEKHLQTCLGVTNSGYLGVTAHDNVLNNLYNVLMDAVIRTRNCELMFTAFSFVRLRGFFFPPSTMGNLLKALGNNRMFDRIMKVWNQLQTQYSGRFTHIVSIGCMLDACVKCNRVDVATDIFDNIRHSAVSPNTILCATMFKAFAKTKDLPRALALKEDMDRDRIELNLISYNSLIDVCVRCGNLSMSAVFLREMQTWNIQPDIVTFSTLIKGYCRSGNSLDKALVLVQEAKCRNLELDEIMFNSLLDGCATAKNAEIGRSVFAEMVSSNIMPSCVSFSILVRLLSTTGHLEEATDLVFNRMKYTWKVEPNSVVYGVLYKHSLPFGDPFQVGSTLMRLRLIPEQQIRQIHADYQNPENQQRKNRIRPKTQWTNYAYTQPNKMFNFKEPDDSIGAYVGW